MAYGADLARLEFWARPPAERERVFAALRATGRPVFVGYSPDARQPVNGFFALTRHEQILEVSRNPEVFSSEPTATSLDDPPPALSDFVGSMISLDDPRHARLRRIVSRAFTPRMIKKFEDDVARLAAEIVDRLVERGPCDFVTEVAMPLPLTIICAMMGIPESAYDDVIDATSLILATGDPDYAGPDGRDRVSLLTEKFSFLHALMGELARERRAHPSDDLVTALVSAEVDGESLTERELGKFFGLLVVAGNETTRTALSHALALFTDHPDQRALLLDDLDARLPGAVEEVVRYATPVTWMRRTVTRDVELLGHTYRAGDRVVLYYNSANRDEAVFDRPDVFDITRTPNPHVGFGGPGPHFCLGAHLARREITVLLRELFTRLPAIHATAPPVRQRSSFVNGINQLPCAF
ncbi:cytochrome P450 [Actinoallomurus purpureus]|uniref:cytochrome P450 n=1 Tax=Actinoallomurus purpureus TaxID=478114 RepID=UPI002092B61E|nr:cytochrome P450 [Actinoallomurus purpureus]MCO6010388.1 cytochrome P450 [Actinoallomurus purpureus]